MQENKLFTEALSHCEDMILSVTAEIRDTEHAKKIDHDDAMNEIIKHCCQFMDLFLEDERIPIFYAPNFRKYNIPVFQKQKIFAWQGINYCPWCGKELPKSLRDEWFSILEKEYNIDDPYDTKQEKLIPQKFKTDEWWKKRGL